MLEENLGSNPMPPQQFDSTASHKPQPIETFWSKHSIAREMIIHTVWVTVFSLLCFHAMYVDLGWRAEFSALGNIVTVVLAIFILVIIDEIKPFLLHTDSMTTRPVVSVSVVANIFLSSTFSFISFFRHEWMFERFATALALFIACVLIAFGFKGGVKYDLYYAERIQHGNKQLAFIILSAQLIVTIIGTIYLA